MNKGTLFIVATPIGNMDDMTFRAVTILKNADIILAEDTRVSKKLMNHYDIYKPLLIYNQYTSDSGRLRILNLLKEGKNLALVTDAGTPGVSDPGNELIELIVKTDPQVKIVPIPGPSALTAALSIAGFNCQKLLFLGFFPKKGLTKTLTLVKECRIPALYYDSPHRVVKNLIKINEMLGNLEVVVVRELTKIHEEVFRGKIQDVIVNLQKSNPKGEVTVIINRIPKRE